MRLKSYYAGTVESAICLARQEMGEDAMLVRSRKTLPESKHLGLYEVVFAAAQEPPRVIRAEQARVEQAPPPAPQHLLEEMAEMRRELARVSAMVSRPAPHGAPRVSAAPNPAIEELERLMAANEVDSEVTGAIVRALDAKSISEKDLRQAFRKSLESRFTVCPEVSPWSFEKAAGPEAAGSRRIVALAGPPGVGKTSMVAKLAVRYGISARRSTHLISFDSHRVASGEQLRAYATILGLSFETIDTVTALAHSLKENSRKDLVLI